MTTATNTAQHTAASLAQLHGRVLDVIAHEKVMQRHVTTWLHIPLDCDADGISGDPIPRYSTSLDAAALLEKALSERKINNDEHLFYVVRGNRNTNFDDDSWTFAGLMAHASARDRTIAAVLAAQEAKPIPPAPISVTEVYDDETGQLLAQHVDSIYGSPIDNNINLWMAMGRKLRFTRKMMEAKETTSEPVAPPAMTFPEGVPGVAAAV